MQSKSFREDVSIHHGDSYSDGGLSYVEDVDDFVQDRREVPVGGSDDPVEVDSPANKSM